MNWNWQPIFRPSWYRRGEMGEVPYQVRVGDRSSASEFFDNAAKYVTRQKDGHLRENYHLGLRKFAAGVGAFASIIGVSLSPGARCASALGCVGAFCVAYLYSASLESRAMLHQKFYVKYNLLEQMIKGKQHYCSVYGNEEGQKLVEDMERELATLRSRSNVYFS